VKVVVFSKYFGYAVGGAERSVLELMKQEEARGNEIVALVAKNATGFGAKRHKLKLPASWDIREFTLQTDLVRFRYIDYYLNKAAMRDLATNLLDTEVLYAYGNLAPAIINAYHGQTVYLVRDEYGLGWNINYYRGIRGLVQSMYHASEMPLRAMWRRDLHKAIARSRLIANSQFIADGLRKMAPHAEIQVARPKIDEEALMNDYKCSRAMFCDERGIVVIGDNVLKGGDIVRQVAARLPEKRFFVFDRHYDSPVSNGNITYMPWQASPGAVYCYASIVMVPSRWAEAFARVVLEAQALGIPVVASNRGGMSEAISDPSMLVTDIENPDEWIQKIRKV
jgi:glycosyltransferase involved in cell wall biosynthesis